MAEKTQATGMVLFEAPPAETAGQARKSEAPPFAKFEFLAHEFLLWLWFKGEHQMGTFALKEGQTELWFDNRMAFLAQQEERVTSTLTGGAPSTTPEARLAILNGKALEEARLGMRRGELEWSFTLKARAGEVVMSGLRLPTKAKENLEELLPERLILISAVTRALDELMEQFLAERTQAHWQESAASEIQTWLMGRE